MGENRNFYNFKKLVVLLMFSILFLTGCEPLRKKFVREKRREDQDDRDKIVILEPKDYSPEFYTPFEHYKKNYDLLIIWNKTLLEDIASSDNDKRLKYVMRKIIKHLLDMEKYIRDDKKKYFKQLMEAYHKIDNEFNKPAQLRNTASLRNKIRINNNKIRSHFNPQAMEGNLIY